MTGLHWTFLGVVVALLLVAGGVMLAEHLHLRRLRRDRAEARQVALSDDPFSHRADGSIQPGDPAYDMLMGLLSAAEAAGPDVQVFGTGHRRADGTWAVEYRDADGRRRCEHGAVAADDGTCQH